LESFDILRIPPDDPLEKADFNIKITRLFARAPLNSSTAFLRHTTRRIVPKPYGQVKSTRELRVRPGEALLLWVGQAFPGCRFGALSSGPFHTQPKRTGDWKVSRTGSLERLPYTVL
jgi:hypothetical protein